ncbi:unnamed protein product [Prorocentrum cordatum]|uniref:Uncharacterized protein n=1 Tax=Prorocentrum cordatum TaxID=2364126 RepID=A0ABN9T5W6_9DINO|nr:unnamed protein product [Polarella glacialis]
MAHHGAWARALAAERAAFVPVPRRRGGGKDPNDLAMGMHATRLVSQGEADFVYLAECLRSWGHRVLILLPEGQHRRLAATFEEARAEVAFYVPRGGYTGRGKFKAVLHSSGEGSIEEASADDYSQSELFDTTEVMNMMIDLGYAESDADPLVPALAKFFVTHKLGSLTVWPSPCAYAQTEAALAENRARTWTRNRRDQVFVFPQAARSAKVDRYGSRLCGAIAKGGGPFVIQDSPDLVTRVLTRLGYCHPDSDASLDEAIDVFFEVGMNRSNMAALGHPTPPHAARRSRAGLLHTLLASSRSSGAWQTAPSDRAVRRLLESAGRLPGAGRASRGQVLAAMRSYAAQRELPPRRSYVGLVHEILKHQRSADPSARV